MGSHGFTWGWQGQCCQAWDIPQGQGVAEPWAAWSGGCDRAAVVSWSRDSCSEEEREGDSTTAGAGIQR